jgi:hypothetical protein
VSITPAGLQVVNQATTRRRELIAGILSRLPAARQMAVAVALREFAAAAGEIPDSQWPADPPEAAVPGTSVVAGREAAGAGAPRAAVREAR